MFWFCQSVFNVMFITEQVKHTHDPLRRKPVAIAQRVAELTAVVSQDRTDFIRHGLDQFSQEHC